MKQATVKTGLCVLLGLFSATSVIEGATMNDYCVKPSFVAATVLPNLLLMIDNSASMYDLSFIDKGSSTRTPSYCYDNTYSSVNQYSGYFEHDLVGGSDADSDGTDENDFYEYDFTSTARIFRKTSTFPDTCTKRVANTLCINISETTPKTITKFVASGNYLNWLTASKFDVQKRILTGGKYVGTSLVAESRGCVGWGFTKEANSGDYVEGQSPTSLGITFSVNGERNPANPTAPSQGGQTSISIYLGDYNHGPCDDAVKSFETATTHQDIRENVAACLTSLVGADVSLETKQKVTFNQAVQECWQYERVSPKTVGNDAVSTVKNQCPDVYKTANSGPASILPGNPALLCSSSYVGMCYAGSAPTWAKDWGGCNGPKCGDECIIERHNAFCGSLTLPTVVDPTDDTYDTSQFANLPAIISDIGVQAQLDKAIGDPLRVMIQQTTAPEGLLQKYNSKIRFGAMAFNYFGSITECGTSLPCPKVCADNPTKTCSTSLDCGGAACNATTSTTNRDGGYIAHYIGSGRCSISTGTACANDSNCPSGENCNSDGVGTHGSGLLNVINEVKGATWTPFAEAYYNAVGYLAKVPSTGRSRTDLRINSDDFVETRNPSQYTCQPNNILLISDGMSTADQNSQVNLLAARYTASGGETGNCSSYAGSKNLDNLAWIARKRNINTFLTSEASTTPPERKNEFITTYVMFNGAPGGTDECSSEQLMALTASKGGTTLRTVGTPKEQAEALAAIFDAIGGEGASGTAASILSSSEGSGANILQAVFYPEKEFEAETKANWIGEIMNLWYYVDPLLYRSTIREDSDQNRQLDLKIDKVANFFLDGATTKIKLYQDTDGDGGGDTEVGVVTPDEVNDIWRAGKQLWARDLSTSPRTIYTPCVASGQCKDDTGLMYFSYTDAAKREALKPYLQADTDDNTRKLMKYIHGYDFPLDATMRSRTVKKGNIPGAEISTDPDSLYVTNPQDKGIGVWKFGDIISSTPRLQSFNRLNAFDVAPPAGYNDGTYRTFINTTDYKARGMVYAGANDGMLHAFKLGQLDVTPRAFKKAELTGSGLGNEAWAFIPKNVLPYLTYLKDPDYGHLYLVDGPTVLFDASIGTPTGCTGDYSACTKDSSTWRSIIVGSMGIGGASAKTCSAGTNCVQAPITDPADAGQGLGYSSYFALDVTDPDTPKLLWEWSDTALGYSTTGPAIVRTGARDKNGKWYVVIGSGPTGPIDTETDQFLAKSDQELKLFVLDLATGGLVQTIDTGITDAFAGSLIGAQIDTDRSDITLGGNYQDDALYFGYVQKNGSGATATWTNGGVVRVLTKDGASGTTPADWSVSKVIENVGPVTAAIARLVDRQQKNLWLYFGTGRYFYKTDDNGTQRSIFGLKDPCYTSSNDLNAACAEAALTKDSLDSQTDDTSPNELESGKQGWYIDLDDDDATFGAERVVTNPVALTNGSVFFTTYKPTADVCEFGGNSFVWATKFDTGVAVPQKAMVGKILLQLSTGVFKEVNIADAFAGKGNRRTSETMSGKPPAEPPPIITNAGNPPIKKVLHIQEK